MKFLADALNIEIHSETWNGAAKLPYYLTDRYVFKKVTLENTTCLFLTPKDELDTLSAVKKHIERVQEKEAYPIVLELNNIEAWRRKSLVKEHIPFVVNDCQIYLPFLGIMLKERYKAREPSSATLMPSSQVLFFHSLYQDEDEIYTSGLAVKFGISEMQISRAVKQLKALELVSAHKDGVRVFITRCSSRKEMFEKAKPHLINPVRKVIYVEHDKVPDALLLANLSALSEISMLNPPPVRTLAYYGKASILVGTDVLIDERTQTEIEIWHYNPNILSNNLETVDLLSLSISLQSAEDERIEQALEDALSKLWSN